MVVPTRDRPRSLFRCLTALARQTRAPDEVIVVDDRSADPSAVRRAASALSSARVVAASGSGPAAARNAGARAAGAPVVCFVDDDCEATPEWLATIVGAVGAGVDAAVGATTVPPRASRRDVATQVIVRGLSESTLDPGTGRIAFGPSCNLAVRSSLIAAVPFDERYPLAAGEDREWCARIADLGHVLGYEPRAVVEHRQGLSPLGFVRQHFRYGRGAHRFHLDPGSAGSRERCLPGLRVPAALVRRGFGGGPAVGALVCLAQAAAVAGFATEAATTALARSGARNLPPRDGPQK